MPHDKVKAPLHKLQFVLHLLNDNVGGDVAGAGSGSVGENLRLAHAMKMIFDASLKWLKFDAFFMLRASLLRVPN